MTSVAATTTAVMTGAKSIILSANTESIILSELPAESVILSVPPAESVKLSAPPADATRKHTGTAHLSNPSCLKIANKY